MFSKQASIYTKFHFNQYSIGLFKALESFLIMDDIKSHHDLACGTGDFVYAVSKLSIESSGSDISPEMISVAKKRFPGLRFDVQDMTKLKLEKKVDLITINYFAMNLLSKKELWRNVFKEVYSSLNRKGYFIFDMASINFIRTSNINSYKQINGDYLLEKILSDGKKCLFEVTWFQKTKKDVFKKSCEKFYEYSYSFKEVKKELLNAGFSKVTFIISKPSIPDKSMNGFNILAKK